jgi:hypothetical protein
MDQVLNSSFPRFSRQAGRGVHVDSLKRVPSALHVQAHRVYDAIASLHRLCELSLVVDIGSDRVQSSRTGRECSPFRVPRRRADLAIMCEKVAHDASRRILSPAVEKQLLQGQDLPPWLFLGAVSVPWQKGPQADGLLITRSGMDAVR